jgi:hypothetical protein
MANVAELIIKFTGQDQVSGTLKNVGQSSSGLSNQLKVLAAAAGGVVAGFQVSRRWNQ